MKRIDNTSTFFIDADGSINIIHNKKYIPFNKNTSLYSFFNNEITKINDNFTYVFNCINDIDSPGGEQQ